MTPRRPPRLSQCSRILSVLEDNEWHSSTELTTLVSGRDPLSYRIREIERMGWPVERELQDGYFGYRLRRAA